MVDDALHHAFAAGNRDLAVRYMHEALCEVINHKDRPTLERWLRLLPEGVIRSNPSLLIIRSWALQFAFRLDLQMQVIHQIEELLDSGMGETMPAAELQILRAQILLAKAQQAFLNNQHVSAIDLCQQILTILPSSWTYARGGAMLYLGWALQASGRFFEAERLLLSEYEACIDKTDVYPLNLLQSMSFSYIWAGQLEKASQLSQLLVQWGIQSGITLLKNWGDYYLGVISYYRNEIENATQFFTEVSRNRYSAHGAAYHDTIACLALIHQIQGESTEAWRLFELLSQLDLEQDGSEGNQTRSLRARLLLMQGDLEAAGLWADTLVDPPLDKPFLWIEEPQITRALILFARGRDTDLQTAHDILDRIEEIAERTHNTCFKIKILALRALVLDAQGKASQADAELQLAVNLARPGGIIRVFVNLGEPMQAMLHRWLAKKNNSEGFIQRIRAGFPQADLNLTGSETSTHAALVEPLTHRENDVLTLLREPLSIKEIAVKLNISYATTRRYTINLYAKLGVNQRWDAVAKAEELTLLPPH